MEKPTFNEALKFWIKLGFISFGGPAGQIAIMHEYLVVQRKWISDSKFLHALNYCMLLPGPEAQQLAIYMGWMMHGMRGGLAAGIFFVLPSMFILAGLSIIYVTFGNLPWINSLFNGLKSAVIAIVILALIKISRKSLVTPFHYFIALAAFVCIFFLNISFPIIIIGSLLLAAIAQRVLPGTISNVKKEKEGGITDESDYFINKSTIIRDSGFKVLRVFYQIIICLCLWILPLIAFYFLTSDFKFWNALIFFFTKAALVTFGGAYAVLPYVAQESVEKFEWLTRLQMIDGLALGETTPGPLIMVLVFVGFMAGYNHFDHSIVMGTVGLVTTSFYTFLPCFFFIFAGAPIIERTQENKKIREILELVTAAVVGVVLNLTIYLGKAVVFPGELSIANIDYLALGWIFISIIALYRFKINMIAWIGVSAFFGLIQYLVKS